MSLMEQLTQLAASQLTKPATQKTGLSESAAASLMPIAMAVLMNGLKKNASTPKGAEDLASALNRHDGSALKDIGRIGNDDMMADGRKILGHVFGPKQGQLETALAKSGGGLDAKQVSALLAMAAPLVLASLGRAKREQGLDSKALSNLLVKEGHAAKSLQGDQLSGLLKMLDADGDGDVSKEAMGFGRKLLAGLFGNKR